LNSTLENLWHEYDLILFFRNALYKKEYSFKDVYFLNFEINRLEKLIQDESIISLNEMLRKTYYRLLKSINKGQKYLVNIINYPNQWTINPIEKDNEAWISDNVLIFTTENKCAVFSHIDRKVGQFKYVDSKWQ
jgi:hypothetical protein